MFKYLFGMLVLAQFTWAALPQTMTACSIKNDYKSQFQMSSTTMAFQVDGKDATGKAFTATLAFDVVGSQDFVTADFKPESLPTINTIADITSFTGGTAVGITSKDEGSSTMYFFEFEPGQYSIIWLTQGSAVALGKTTDCK